MAQKCQTPARGRGRQRFSTDHVQNSAHIANPGTAQPARPTFADIENFTGEQYDEVYENALAAAINRYIINTSICVDNADAIFVRPSEIIAALATVMAKFIAMDPHATPATIDKGVARISEHLRSLAVEMVGEPRTLMIPATQGEGWLS